MKKDIYHENEKRLFFLFKRKGYHLIGRIPGFGPVNIGSNPITPKVYFRLDRIKIIHKVANFVIWV